MLRGLRRRARFFRDRRRPPRPRSRRRTPRNGADNPPVQTRTSRPPRPAAGLHQKTGLALERRNRPRLEYGDSADRGLSACRVRPRATLAKRSEWPDCQAAAGLWTRPPRSSRVGLVLTLASALSEGCLTASTLSIAALADKGGFFKAKTPGPQEPTLKFFPWWAELGAALRVAGAGRGIVGFQYFGTLWSISSAQAAMPPLTFFRYLNPCSRRNFSAFSERTPVLQWM